MAFFDGQTCGVCGVEFGLTSENTARVKNNGASFYCPNGHRLSFRETELDKLRRELAAMTADRDRHLKWRTAEQLDARRMVRRINALRGVITRMKRARNGLE